MKIKNLPRLTRPREKLIHYGPQKLSTSELLAIIIGSGNKKENALQLAKRILKSNIFSKKLNIAHLNNIQGIGKAKACQIIASLEFAKRLINKKNESKEITHPKDIFNLLYDIKNNKKEYFIAFYLDSRNLLIKKEIISIGTLNASLVHPREIFEPAIRYLSAQIIIAHNHPSGNSNPSKEDILITKKLVSIGNMLDIKVIDHIIVTNDEFYSFREHQLIQDELEED